MCQTKVQSDSEIRAKAPKRPYRNFAQFCLQYLSASRVALGKCPCLVCYGRGWNYHPDSQSDPVEGNKHRETEKCEACQGTGEGSRKACLEKYGDKINEWLNKVTLFKEQIKRRRRAITKLNKDEIEALKNLGL